MIQTLASLTLAVGLVDLALSLRKSDIQTSVEWMARVRCSVLPVAKIATRATVNF